MCTLIHGFLGTDESACSNGISIGLSVSAEFIDVSNTDRDHERVTFVPENGIHAMRRCGLIILLPRDDVHPRY